MKKQIEDIIQRANSVILEHHGMTADSISKELSGLREDLAVVEGSLISVEEEVELASNLLERAIVAVNTVSDAFESHINVK
jgi:hypothetical protein